MKWFFVLFVSALVLQAQDPQGGGSSGAPAAQTSPAAGAARPLTIPAGAVWDSKGYYRYTDAQGKKWIYRKTPAGVMRLEDVPAPAAKIDGSRPRSIPADAVHDENGDYHATDAQGKKWIYRRTPFGVAMLEDAPQAAAEPAAAPSSAGIRATEDGDVVHFVRQGPFGAWKWTRKKSELDETEKAALENSRAKN